MFSIQFSHNRRKLGGDKSHLATTKFLGQILVFGIYLIVIQHFFLNLKIGLDFPKKGNLIVFVSPMVSGIPIMLCIVRVTTLYSNIKIQGV